VGVRAAWVNGFAALFLFFLLQFDLEKA